MLGSWFSRAFSRRSKIDVGASTDIGYVRNDNEDAYGVFSSDGRDRDRLLIVADGMGGFARGSEASFMAVSAIKAAYYGADGDPAERLRRAFDEANSQVFGRASDLRLRMGTTCTALSLTDVAVVAHVGDSRLYKVTPGHIVLLTEDHTLATELRTHGVISDAEAQGHPSGHALTRALGVADAVTPSVSTLARPAAPCWFVLCTDGLRRVDEHRMADLVRRLGPQQASEALVSAANKTGGIDNSTVVVVRVS